MIEEVKLVSLCAHNYQKSLNNFVELPCSKRQNFTHKISQIGKICNKCTQIINDSYTYSQDCIGCYQKTEKIIQYLKQRELCPHQNREFQLIYTPCLDKKGEEHEVPLPSLVCNNCSIKLKAAFNNYTSCKICEQKQQIVFQQFQKLFVSPILNHLKNIFVLLQKAKATPEIYKNQIQSMCRSQPLVERIPNKIIDQKMIQQFKKIDNQQNHQSKRYKLYSKCPKHNNQPITVCNLCLVALVNLDCCPYGCKDLQKTKPKPVSSKIQQIGFIFLYPNHTKQSSFLQLFSLKLTQEKGRLDRWQCNIKKINAKSQKQKQYSSIFPMFYSSAIIAPRTFLITGGVIGPNINTMKSTNKSFIITVSKDIKQYQIQIIPPMTIPRSGHSSIYIQDTNEVLVVGGLSQGKECLKSTQIYSIKQKKWRSSGDMTLDRSKPTVFYNNGNVYVLGGISANPYYLYYIGQKYNIKTKQWILLETGQYFGYELPHFTNCLSLSQMPLSKKTKGCYLIGGSNRKQSTLKIRQFSQKDDKFSLKVMNSELNGKRFGGTIGQLGEDNILIFGGSQEHENFLKIDLMKVIIKNNKFQPFFVEQIQIKSYQGCLREKSDIVYGRIYQQLQRKGLIQQSKLLAKKEGEKTMRSFDNQLLEKLWFGYGKQFGWIQY